MPAEPYFELPSRFQAQETDAVQAGVPWLAIWAGPHSKPYSPEMFATVHFVLPACSWG